MFVDESTYDEDDMIVVHSFDFDCDLVDIVELHSTMCWQLITCFVVCDDARCACL